MGRQILAEAEEHIPIESQVMRIQVNSGPTFIDTADWSRAHEKELKDGISRAVFQLGYPGRRVDVRVAYG
jgi:hypothetical protein